MALDIFSSWLSVTSGVLEMTLVGQHVNINEVPLRLPLDINAYYQYFNLSLFVIPHPWNILVMKGETST
jgi:hypothetical protein